MPTPTSVPTPAPPLAHTPRAPMRLCAAGASRIRRVLGAGALLLACGGVPAQPAAPVAAAPLQAVAVDVARYTGTWYQIALYPNFFQRQCAADTQAHYRQKANGRIEVLNRCRNEAGETVQALGEARVEGPGRLKVRFAPDWLAWLPVVWADYWVVHLQPDYRWVVVSEPDRDYLWVLSRTPALDAADEAQVRLSLTRLGFDLTRLQWEKHGQPLPAPQP